MVSLSSLSVKTARETSWKKENESEMKIAYVGERKGEEGTEWLDSKVLSVWLRLLSKSDLHSRSSSSAHKLTILVNWSTAASLNTEE